MNMDLKFLPTFFHHPFRLFIFVILLNLSGFIFSNSVISAHELLTTNQSAFVLPKTLSLCGEPVPLENRHVWEMLDHEFTIAVYDRAQVFLWLKRAGRYFPHIEQMLDEAGMPVDLKYLAVAESSLRPHIHSRRGAVGLWQFIPETAHRFKLMQNQSVDQRRSPEGSCEAALAYLKELKGLFGSWTLALAAYNCGEDRLKKEIQQQRVRSYYELNLPLETERFVFRIAAIKLIMENPERYGFQLAPESIYRPPESEPVEIHLDRPVHITDLAEAIDSKFKIIKELNPDIKGYYLPGGLYRLKVPAGKKELTQAVLRRLSSSSSTTGDPSKTSYVVKAGDTLSLISKNTGVSIAELQRINNLTNTIVKIGQKLWVSP